MNAVFPPWPIREFRERSDGIPESGREDSIFRGAGEFFGRTGPGALACIAAVEVPQTIAMVIHFGVGLPTCYAVYETEYGRCKGCNK